MHQPIDRRGRRHLVAEDPIPVREDQIARDEDGAALVALSQEREENFGLLGTLLDVADVVEDQHRELIEFAQGARQLEVALRRQELLHEAIRRHEEHGVAAIVERVAHRAQGVALPDARQPERQDIGGVVQEVAVGELVESAHQRRRQAAFIEGVEGFPRRELGGPTQARDAPLVPLLRFEVRTHGERADVEYLRIVQLASTAGDARVAEVLAACIDRGGGFDYVAVQAQVAPPALTVPVIHIPAPDLSVYDALRAGAAA